MIDVYGLTVTTDPTAEPLSLDECKTYLRVDHSEDDDFILSLIVAARQYCEAVTKRSFVTQTMTMYTDTWPSGDTIEIPRPFYSTTAVVVSYYAAGSTTSTSFAASNYWVDDSCEPGRIVLRDSAEWPTTDLRSAKAVEVVFQSGYGGEADVPDGIKAAMRFLVGHWYANREAVVVGRISQALELSVTALLSPHISAFVA